MGKWLTKANISPRLNCLDNPECEKHLADVLNKLDCGGVDHSIDSARYRVEWLCSVLVRLGGRRKPTASPTRSPAIPCHSRHGQLF